MKRTHCVFCYATKEARKAGEMEYTVDCDSLDEARDVAQAEIDEGMYCASIYERVAFAAPMQFVEAHIQPVVTVAEA